ncbi:hypothetical protein BDV96DRAFT_574450 [Lophiotrema nucula]|uniref:Uncharacterized protein n=1 Tax=Lophiotrema nucula TaxID=690887 RepID=A0A6A5Z8C6_9PLEO|nr:hypothetical protein BDV96DRAFT_574450 [Lophiotrema nucula]
MFHELEDTVKPLQHRRSSWSIKQKLLPSRLSRSRNGSVPSIPSMAPILSHSSRLTKSLRPITEAAETKPGDAPTARASGQKITAEEVKEFRELIRYRYSLDVDIWSLRHVKVFQRDIVYEKMRKSDAALRKIQNTIRTWDKREYFTSDREFRNFQEVKKRVLQSGKREWMNHPPWEEAELERYYDQ